MHGGRPSDPGKYRKEFEIIREFGWSWQELYAAPSSFVEEAYLRIQYERRAQNMARQNNDINS